MIFRDWNLAIFTGPILTLPEPSPLKCIQIVSSIQNKIWCATYLETNMKFYHDWKLSFLVKELFSIEHCVPISTYGMYVPPYIQIFCGNTQNK